VLDGLARRRDPALFRPCGCSALFAASGNSSAFAKVDYTFGDDIDGFGAKLGMRYNW
jgi:hypothetical protein